MGKYNLKVYYDIFIEAAVTRTKAIQTGDSKIANRQYTILKRIFCKAQKHPDTFKDYYKQLRNSNIDDAQVAACAHSLALGQDIAEAENILKKLSQKEDIGVLSLEAEMILKVWKKQGYLRF